MARGKDAYRRHPIRRIILLLSSKRSREGGNGSARERMQLDISVSVTGAALPVVALGGLFRHRQFDFHRFVDRSLCWGLDRPGGQRCRFSELWGLSSDIHV